MLTYCCIVECATCIYAYHSIVYQSIEGISECATCIYAWKHTAECLPATAASRLIMTINDDTNHTGNATHTNSNNDSNHNNDNTINSSSNHNNMLRIMITLNIATTIYIRIYVYIHTYIHIMCLYTFPVSYVLMSALHVRAAA